MSWCEKMAYGQANLTSELSDLKNTLMETLPISEIWLYVL